MNIEMSRIKEYEEVIKVPCESCLSRGVVTHNCQRCGGNGVHKKTIKVWKIVSRNEIVQKIDRDEYGELRYWVGYDTFYHEEKRLLHFTEKDAEKECKNRNHTIQHILEIQAQNKVNKPNKED